MRPFQRASHIYRLFLYWEHQLGIWPKGTTYQLTSPFMREELRRLDAIAAPNYMATNRIETLDDLFSAREALQGEMNTLTTQRTKLRICRASPAEKEQVRGAKQAVTKKITACRKKLKLNMGVEERSTKIQDTMLMYGKEASNRKQEIDRQHRTIPNQRPKDKSQ